MDGNRLLRFHILVDFNCFGGVAMDCAQKPPRLVSSDGKCSNIKWAQHLADRLEHVAVTLIITPHTVKTRLHGYHLQEPTVSPVNKNRCLLLTSEKPPHKQVLRSKGWREVQCCAGTYVTLNPFVGATMRSSCVFNLSAGSAFN